MPASDGGYKIGVLVQANFGSRDQLTIDGVPVGRELSELVPVASNHLPVPDDGKEGSVIIVIATDAPVFFRATGAHRAACRHGPGPDGKHVRQLERRSFHCVLDRERDSAARLG